MTVCNYEVIEGILKVNCKGCVFGSSIEDFDVCMATTIDKLRNVKKIDRIILSERREHEYDYEQTKLLLEVANLYNKLLSEERVLESPVLMRIQRVLPGVREELEMIIREMLRRDPIAAYVKIKRLIRRYRTKFSRSKGTARKNYQDYWHS